MRRMRNIGAAAVLVVGSFVLFTLYRPELSEAYRLPVPHSNAQDHAPESSALPHVSAIPEQPKYPNTLVHSQLGPTSSFSQSSLTTIPSLSATSVLVDIPQSPANRLETQTISISDGPVFDAELPFQQDLELYLPVETLNGFSSLLPHNHDPNGPKTNAYATFMATRNPSIKDPYFLAIQSLIYRVLWSPRSRTEKYPFVVFVADFVTTEQRQLLSGAGAIVRELAPLEWNPNVEGALHRWKDLFAKLNMWNQTDFLRILFLDADAFPVVNIDAMFDISPTQECIAFNLQPDDYLADGTSVCEPYVFSGVPQAPFNTTDVNINVGSMVFSPSERMHQRLLQNYVKTDRYNCLMAEQAFLNWQFSINGAFPATMLSREYGGFFPQEDEEGKLKVVHEKLWSPLENRRWLKEEWAVQWREMLDFYAASEFLDARVRDGVKTFPLANFPGNG